MLLEWRGNRLFIRCLPLASMGRLAYFAPQTPEEWEVLAALLAGARVYLPPEALEYKRYRKTAPLGVYQKLVGMERRLREMGLCVSRASHR